MKAPDKIYIQPNAHDKWWDGNKPNDNFQEYIRRDALLEWAETNRDNLAALSDNDAVRWGQQNAFQQMIDKLNKL